MTTLLDDMPVFQYQDHIGINLITTKEENKNQCIGAYVLEISSEEIHTFAAPLTFLATGGGGKVFVKTFGCQMKASFRQKNQNNL